MTGRFSPLALPSLARRLMKRTFSELSASNSISTSSRATGLPTPHPSLPARPTFTVEELERGPKVQRRHASSSLAASLKRRSPSGPAQFTADSDEGLQRARLPPDSKKQSSHEQVPEPEEHVNGYRFESEDQDMPSNHRSLSDRIGPRRGQPLPPQKAASSRGVSQPSAKGKKKEKKETESYLSLPVHDEAYIAAHFGSNGLKATWRSNPKSSVANFLSAQNKLFNSTYSTGLVKSGDGKERSLFRCEVLVDVVEGIVGVGDAPVKKDAERLASLSALAQLWSRDLLTPKGHIKTSGSAGKEKEEVVSEGDNALSDGTVIDFEHAEHFVEWYCKRFKFARPVVETQLRMGAQQSWEAILEVDGNRVGVGRASQKNEAKNRSYIDTVVYMEACDPELWKEFKAAFPEGGVGVAPEMRLGYLSHMLENSIRDLARDVSGMALSANRPKQIAVVSRSGLLAGMSIDVPNGNQSEANEWMMDDAPPKSVLPIAPSAPLAMLQSGDPSMPPSAPRAMLESMDPSSSFHMVKSKRMLESLKAYQRNPAMEAMRTQRASLPVTQHIDELFRALETNDVVVCMAATGSGKTTQIPQLLLDRYTEEGHGSEYNILCTQPRRIAAISVAQRVANERGERLGQSIGYSVRFDQVRPKLWGSVTFCTTGIFLKMMQGALEQDSSQLDAYTHVIVDEVHERDVDTDLALVVLKRLLQQRKAAGKSLKVILMSATIDPTLFKEYFAEENGSNQADAPVIEIPGRSYPVEKKFLDTILPEMDLRNLASGRASWVFQDPSVAHYLEKEVGTSVRSIIANGKPEQPAVIDKNDEPEIPYPLIALVIAHVISRSDDGHVLVFMPGWDEMARVRDILLDPARFPLLGQSFGNSLQYELHYLHSSVPVAEQQAVFEPPRRGVRRIILATNIAETSVTIPDVVYVVDAGRVKEMRYDPERHLSSLVSAWVGRSNLNQRAGRAGRHRPGQYYGVLTKAREEAFDPYQLVEMQRVDLSNVVMHVRAIIPSMPARDVLAITIEPPAVARVNAAIKDLQRMGALDDNVDLTALGKILVQIPTDSHLAKLCLFGSFFRCLDPALTLAAVMASRDPFVAPIGVRKQAHAVKESWSPQQYRSDILAAVAAYDTWRNLQNSGNIHGATRFISENYLHRPTIVQIQRIKLHLLSSLEKAGVLAVSGGGVGMQPSSGRGIPPELNTNAQCLPLLAALIAMATQPNFAIKTTAKIFRTYQDRTCLMHASSVNSSKGKDKGNELYSSLEAANSGSDLTMERNDRWVVFSFAEKVRNVSQGEKGAATQLRTTTRLDPMTYMLFGAHEIQATPEGVLCDLWLPVTGHKRSLDDINRLKGLMNACMLRVFDGIYKGMTNVRKRGPPAPTIQPMGEDEYDDHDSVIDDEGDASGTGPLAAGEIKELDFLTQSVVQILDRYNEETNVGQSRVPSRPSTPSGHFSSLLAPGLRGPTSGSRLGLNQGLNSRPPSTYSTRPSTPSNWRQ